MREPLPIAPAPPGHRAPSSVKQCDAAISRYHTKKSMPFCSFFYVRPKIPKKITQFSFISKVFGHFEQAELRGIPMGPHGPPNAKETAQIAPEIAIFRKPGHFGLVDVFLAKQAILAILAISEAGWTSRKKVPFGSWLRCQRPS